MSDQRTPPDIKWYRTKLPADVLEELNERDDVKGFLQAGGFFATMLATGASAYYFYTVQNWWLFALFVFLHGTVCAFNINAVHELSHKTVFKTSWLNTLFGHLFGFIGWNNNRFFWLSHKEHHKYTLHPDDDQEVVVPMTHSIWNWFIGAFFSYWGYRMNIRYCALWATGDAPDEWADRVCPANTKERRSVVNWSRTIIAGHVLITAVSLYFGNWAIPLLVSLTPLYGGWLFLLCNNTQHAGLIENVADFRLNCRTFYVNPIVKFLYWHMNWHVEHHMYAAVPCYKLEKLHNAIKHDLPHCPNGLIETWVEIGYIMYRQKEDINYRFVAELPGDLGEELSDRSRLRQIREQADGRLKQSQPTTATEGRKWQCRICAFIYEEAKGLPEEGIAPGTSWDDIPDDWRCPDCGVSKAEFDMVEITTKTDTRESKIASSGKPVIILGSGLAGYGLAKEFRKYNKSQPVILITRDNGDVYSKPMLSTALANGKAPETLVQMTAHDFENEYGIEIKTNTEVTDIDRSKTQVTLKNGDTLYYSRLILATGADPISLPTKCDASQHIHSVNDLSDYARFRKAIPEGGKITILGAGLIGCEFANDLALSGHKVEVIDMAPQPLGRLAPPEIGTALAQALEEQGVLWHFNTSLSTLEKQDNGKLVAHLGNGKTIESDVVLSAIGLRPRISLAEKARLKINRGIQTNDYLETSDPSIFALGDCAEINGRLLPYILPLNASVKALAKTLNGEKTKAEFGAMPVTVKTPSLPLEILPPHPEAQGTWEVTGEKRDLTARFKNSDGQTLGFALCGKSVKERNTLVNTLSEAPKEQSKTTAIV